MWEKACIMNFIMCDKQHNIDGRASSHHCTALKPLQWINVLFLIQQLTIIRGNIPFQVITNCNKNFRFHLRQDYQWACNANQQPTVLIKLQFFFCMSASAFWEHIHCAACFLGITKDKFYHNAADRELRAAPRKWFLFVAVWSLFTLLFFFFTFLFSCFSLCSHITKSVTLPWV